MLFHEIYGSYYDAVAAILREALQGELTPGRMTELVRRQAFSESLLTIPDGLRGEKWHLTRRDLSTPIQCPPTMPLTLLQRRWLKALLLDPRIRLFGPDETGLEAVEPLFTPDMFVFYDRYADGDNYADPDYITHFQTILRALREERGLSIDYESRRGESVALTVTPRYLEYSEKDDRFRLIAADGKRGWIVNLSRVRSCALTDRNPAELPNPAPMAVLTFEVTNVRNALERVLLHFSHLQKETERLDGNRYRITLHYDRQDETELLIRLLAFGPTVRVLEPRHFRGLLKRRIDRQMRLMADDAEGVP